MLLIFKFVVIIISVFQFTGICWQQFIPEPVCMTLKCQLYFVLLYLIPDAGQCYFCAE